MHKREVMEVSEGRRAEGQGVKAGQAGQGG
jgi:hypothetical protein